MSIKLIQKKALTPEEAAEARKDYEEFQKQKLIDYNAELESYRLLAESLIEEGNFERSCTALQTTFKNAKVVGYMDDKYLDATGAETEPSSSVKYLQRFTIFVNFPKKGVIKLESSPVEF